MPCAASTAAAAVRSAAGSSAPRRPRAAPAWPAGPRRPPGPPGSAGGSRCGAPQRWSPATGAPQREPWRELGTGMENDGKNNDFREVLWFYAGFCSGFMVFFLVVDENEFMISGSG